MKRILSIMMLLLIAACGDDINTNGDVSPPSPPIILTANAVSWNQVYLLWESSTDDISVSGYKIVRNGVVAGMSETNLFSDSDLSAATLYCYIVTAFDMSGNESDESDEVCAITRPTLPDTGQTKSHTHIPGEDSDYTINPPRYSDNSDGTVTDEVTGLTWQQHDDGIMWAFSNAAGYCNNLSLSDFHDWRLPNIRELISIVDYENYNPAINTIFFPGTKSEFYWTSDLSVNYVPNQWSVHFQDGSDFWGYDTAYIRCVRGNQLKSPLFRTDDDGTVTDKTTGLTWQQEENTWVNWESSLSSCENLILAGFSDWRLPNVKEMASIVNLSQFAPTVDPMYFSVHYWTPYWTSTTSSENPSIAWTVELGDGRVVGWRSKDESFPYKCVRGGS